jgi:hypothetical protein
MEQNWTWIFLVVGYSGWMVALVLGMGWWLMKRGDDHEREIVTTLNTLKYAVEREIGPALGQLNERLAKMEHLSRE